MSVLQGVMHHKQIPRGGAVKKQWTGQLASWLLLHSYIRGPQRSYYNVFVTSWLLFQCDHQMYALITHSSELSGFLKIKRIQVNPREEQ